MALQISFFKGIVSSNSSAVQIAPLPFAVLEGEAFTVPSGATFMRIQPNGDSYNITWSNGLVETFSSVEFRGCNKADTFTAAVL